MLGEHNATSYAKALVQWHKVIKQAPDVKNTQQGALINATQRRCVWVTSRELICYMLVLNAFSCSPVNTH
jgi:hypothetical protein